MSWQSTAAMRIDSEKFFRRFTTHLWDFGGFSVLKVGGALRWSRSKRRHFLPVAGASQGKSLRFSVFGIRNGLRLKKKGEPLGSPDE